jgi:transcriptional regulator with PAS, ATPase and Fis domain
MRLAAITHQPVIPEDDLWEGVPAPQTIQPASVPAPVKAVSLKKAVTDLEKHMIAGALESTRNNQQQAARLLGLSRQGLINKMKRYAIAG